MRKLSGGTLISILVFFCGSLMLIYLSLRQLCAVLTNTPAIFSQNEDMNAVQQAETLCLDTECLLEEYDLSTHNVQIHGIALPDKFIGMTREQLRQSLQTYSYSLPLSEKKDTVRNITLSHFSRERIILRKTIRSEALNNGYYIGVYNHNLIVYLEDMKTVYLETDLLLDKLSEPVRSEVIQMKRMENDEILFDFLENVTS